MDNNDRLIGKLLDDRYEIIERIGTGGMAVVYKAMDNRLNRYVALKVLKEELAEDPDFRKRFQTESQAVAMLSHPNIVAVYDVSKTDSVEYIVMELIEGITLKQYINRKGALSWREAHFFATQIVKALNHAHSRGIIHRDIKPHNIMLLKDGTIKVADFGIARLTNQTTVTQEAMGSVHYISPEQAKGEQVDIRTDIYSFGVVMYEMLTGRLPFEGDSPVAVAIQHISAVPLMPREINDEIPAGLEDIVMHAMEPKLSSRYSTTDEIITDLEEFKKNPSVTFKYGVLSELRTNNSKNELVSEPVSVVKKGQKPEPTKEEFRRHRRKSNSTAWLIGLLIVVIFLVGIVIFVWKGFLKGILEPEKIAVYDFVGKRITSVENNDSYSDYDFDIAYEYNDDYDEGIIIDQSIEPEREVTLSDDGVKLTLTVSKGSEPVADIHMPDVVGKDYRQAKIDLENIGLNLQISVEGVYDEDSDEGEVLYQVPEEGAVIKSGNSVFITYSLGPQTKTTVVPSVEGVSMTSATSRLTDRDLLYTIEYEDSEEPVDTVLYQSIEGGTEVEVKTTVILHVSNGAFYGKSENENNPENTEPGNNKPGIGESILDFFGF